MLNFAVQNTLMKPIESHLSQILEARKQQSLFRTLQIQKNLIDFLLQRLSWIFPKIKAKF